MKRLKVINLVVGILFGTLAAVCSADDTDIYLNPGSGLPPGSEPMVMFSLDYRPNLGSTVCNGDECNELIDLGYLPEQDSYTFFDVLRAVLRRVFEPLEGVRVGLMLNHDNAVACNGPTEKACSNGGYIAMGFEPFVKGDTNGAKARFHAILDAMPTPQGGQAHSYQGKELFFEFFRYLSGQEIYNGHNGWTDFFTDETENADVDAVGKDRFGNPASYAWDPSVESGDRYISPFRAAGQCSSLYTVNLMFQVSNQEDGADTDMAASIDEGGLAARFRNFAGVIRYLNDADLGDGNYGDIPDLDDTQNVTSYFIVDPNQINVTTTSYAFAGGTGLPLPLSEDPEELQNILENIFKQVLSVSTTFVAASVPVNVFNRAEVVDNVFLALFEVDENLKPFWVGNLKKLRLADNGISTFLADADGRQAVAADGRIAFDALTFWTDGAQLPPPDPNSFEVAGRDGRTVDRGGAGQQLAGIISGTPGATNASGGRTIYYDRGASLRDFDATAGVANDVQADFGAIDANESLELIEFSRGLDIDDLDGDNDTSEARPWIFGDPLHSRPLPVNYGAINGYSETNQAIFLAVASNDGMLRFIRNTTPGGADSGEEVWAFMPRASMGAMKTLRDNAVGAPHPYTFDGSPTVYLEDSNFNGNLEAGERAYLFAGMRRGGKSYFGLDITDPENPSLLWTIEKGGNFAELGYTFSTPRVGFMNFGSGPEPVVVFAGGYDFNKDDRTTVGTDDSEGAAIYIVDAETGQLIWKAVGPAGSATGNTFIHPELVDSIPSTVTAVDTDGDFMLDRIVVGDSGGNIWRADVNGPDPSQYKLTLLAQLGRHESGGKENDRRFFHRPDFVQAEDEHGLFDAIVIGSGDRADPLDQAGVTTNFFYVIKDRNIASGGGVDRRLAHSALADVTDNCLQNGAAACATDVTDGWRLQLEDTGEKALATAITIDNKVFFTTYIPAGGASTACAPDEGAGRVYAVNLANATSVINYDTTDDDPNYVGEATTKSDRSTDLLSPGIPAEVVSIPPNQLLRPDLQIETVDVTTRWRTFWYLTEDTDL